MIVMCAYISIKTSNVIVHPHIEKALFIYMVLTMFVFPFFSSTVILAKYKRMLVLHELIYNAARISELITPNCSTCWGLKHNHTKVKKRCKCNLSSKWRVYA